MKQTKHWLMTSAVLLCSLTVNAHDFEVDGIFYNFTSTTMVEVTYGIVDKVGAQYVGEVVIPARVDYDNTTYDVVGIGERAFEADTSLIAVTLPESIVRVGERAFRNCRNLVSITIPQGITSVGLSAFDGTAWLDNQPDGMVYAGHVLYTYKGTTPENTIIEIDKGTKSISAFTVYNHGNICIF